MQIYTRECKYMDRHEMEGMQLGNSKPNIWENFGKFESINWEKTLLVFKISKN